MSQSVVDICNIALTHIGITSKIQSLDEKTEEARQCKLLYPLARDATLSDHDWNFARRASTLAEVDEEFPGWNFVYRFPSDCLKARKIYDPINEDLRRVYDPEVGIYTSTNKIPFDIASNEAETFKVILTNQPQAVLIYTKALTNPILFDSNFIDALSWKLATYLSQPLRGDLNLTRSSLQFSQLISAPAKASNSNESYKGPSDSNTFLQARG